MTSDLRHLNSFPALSPSDQPALPTVDFQNPVPKGESFGVDGGTADDKANDVSPRNDVELRLFQIWQEILGLSDFGINEDFFQLGGDSLRSFELCLHIQRAFNFSLSTTQLGDACTVKQLAEMLRGGFERAQPERSSDYLVELRSGETRAPLFCFPGHVAQFRKLAELLEEGIAVQGVLLPDFSRTSGVPKNMEELASFSLTEMQRIQPKGPYFLAGYSFGGGLAYEIAQQLTAAGEEVALLALWDSDLDPQSLRSVISRFMLKLRGVPSWPLRTKCDYVMNRLSRGVRSLLKSGALSRCIPRNDSGQREILVRENIVQYQYAVSAIEAGYRPLPFSGRLHIFRASERTVVGKLKEYFYIPYWLSLAKDGVEVHVVPATMVRCCRNPTSTISPS